MVIFDGFEHSENNLAFAFIESLAVPACVTRLGS